MSRLRAGLAASLVVVLAMSSSALARNEIRVVFDYGASTYPFLAAAAELFMKSGVSKVWLESDGYRTFCAGIGPDYPDLLGTSGRLKQSDLDRCATNGVSGLVEITIGFDAVVVARPRAGTALNVTQTQVFLALAEQVPDADGRLVPNPHKTWSDIDPSLPNVAIEVLGEPPTSATRDAFQTLFMVAGAEQAPAMQALKMVDVKHLDRIRHSMRRDGGFVEASEGDNAIAASLDAKANAYGIFPFSYLRANAAKLRASAVAGVEPSIEAIRSGKYKGSRPLFVYVKKQHIGHIPGLDKFAATLASGEARGEGGLFAKMGLVPVEPGDQPIEIDLIPSRR